MLVRQNVIKLTSFAVDMYVPSTAWPVFSMAVESALDSFRLNPLSAAPRSEWSCASSDHRFNVRRVTFSIGPLTCDANLLVKASESKNR